MTRRDKINYYLDIAETVSQRGTCLRRNFGAIIVKDDEILSTGYTGAPRGRKNCCDLGSCRRENLRVSRGERYELCRSVHAEANAIIVVARRDCLGAAMYLVGREIDGAYVQDASSCPMCRRLIINAGITTVIIRQSENTYAVIDVDAEWVTNDDSLSESLTGY